MDATCETCHQLIRKVQRSCKYGCGATFLVPVADAADKKGKTICGPNCPKRVTLKRCACGCGTRIRRTAAVAARTDTYFVDRSHYQKAVAARTWVPNGTPKGKK